ncbi:FliA/WhiG subfamily RNA polymerase sigma-28 subunit [Rubrobacter xylanophilus]|uniref:FliA/WhiG subfamily RNA polymerase sigma-28 subunit n=1 Tax=Rubrobacter xylanophilus TaxID=49319 RepID=A0A510HFA7_9ACTN|nr:sigma-70 family RNA polymerase sigma factor [Rubrobacter xylanophilus]BBL78618.1 FliA/WhiG subfamily RNA polymerase sigma-28 subunit [Rubrobacter xylanophilus]
MLEQRTTRYGKTDPAGLVAAYREHGDRRALERLFASQGALLGSIVRRYAGSSREPREDLLQAGYVGLMKAVNGYDPSCGASFGSYAYAMMEGEIRHHLRDSGLVRRPRWASSLHARISEATARLTRELGRPPLPEEVAREANITPEGLKELMKLYFATNVSSLDEEPDIGAIRSLHYESFSLPVEDRIWLEEALESLSELQRRAVYLFFYKDLTQTEIGRRLGVSQRKVSRLVASALRNLARGLEPGSGGKCDPVT